MGLNKLSGNAGHARHHLQGGNFMKIIFPLVLAFAGTVTLSACGTFPLASSIQSPINKDQTQRETDILFCTHQADMAVNSASNQAGDFLLGATIVGAPIAYEMDKSKERGIFASCMTARGYNLVMPDGSSRQSTLPLQTIIPTITSAPSSSASNQNVTEKSGFSAVYPPAAAKLNHHGTAVLLVLVGTDGTVKDVEVESTSGYTELDQAAMDAVHQWTFNPEIRNGRKVEGYARIPITF